MDKALLAIARTAEQGGQAPMVQLLTGNYLVGGQPVSQQAFCDAWIEAGLQADHRAIRMESVAAKEDHDTVLERKRAEGNSLLEPVRKSFTDELDALCFAPASAALLSTGETAEVPCLRVPLEQIAAWWGGQVDWKQKGDGIGFFVGGLFPIDWE